MLALLVVRLRRRAAARQRLPVPRDPDPVPDPVARGARAEHPGRLLRPDLARHRRASWRSARTRPTTSCVRIDGMPLIAGAAARRRCAPTRRRHAVRHPEPAHQGPLPRGGDAGRAVLRRLGVPAHQAGSPTTRRRARSRVADLQVFGLPIDTPVEQVPVLPRRRWCVFALLAKNLVRGAHRPRVDGDARHGRGRRGDRHPPGVRQADRVRGQLVHRRRGRRAVGLRLPRRVGAGGVQHRPLVPAAVHGDHRRPRLDPGQLLRRRVHRHRCRSCSNQVPALARHPDRRPRPRRTSSS